MHGKDQKKVFTIGDSVLKNITGTVISRDLIPVLQVVIYVIILNQNFVKNLM